MGLAVNASTLGMAAAGIRVADLLHGGGSSGIAGNFLLFAGMNRAGAVLVARALHPSMLPNLLSQNLDLTELGHSLLRLVMLAPHSILIRPPCPIVRGSFQSGSAGQPGPFRMFHGTMMPGIDSTPLSRGL